MSTALARLADQRDRSLIIPAEHDETATAPSPAVPDHPVIARPGQ